MNSSKFYLTLRDKRDINGLNNRTASKGHERGNRWSQ